MGGSVGGSLDPLAVTVQSMTEQLRKNVCHYCVTAQKRVEMGGGLCYTVKCEKGVFSALKDIGRDVGPAISEYL